MNIPFDRSSVAHLVIGFAGFYFGSQALVFFRVDEVIAHQIFLAILIVASLFKELNDRGRWVKWLVTSRSKSGFDFWDLVYSIVPTLIYLGVKYM